MQLIPKHREVQLIPEHRQHRAHNRRVSCEMDPVPEHHQCQDREQQLAREVQPIPQHHQCQDCERQLSRKMHPVPQHHEHDRRLSCEVPLIPEQHQHQVRDQRLSREVQLVPEHQHQVRNQQLSRDTDPVPERRQHQEHDRQLSRETEPVPECRQHQDHDQQLSRAVQPIPRHHEHRVREPFDNYIQREYVRPPMGWGHDSYEDVLSPSFDGYPSAPKDYTYQPQPLEPLDHSGVTRKHSQKSRTRRSNAPLQAVLNAEHHSRPTSQYRGDLGRHSRINPQSFLATTHDAPPPSSRGLVSSGRMSQKPPNRIPPVGSSRRFENSFASSSKSHENRSLVRPPQFENAFASSSKSHEKK